MNNPSVASRSAGVPPAPARVGREQTTVMIKRFANGILQWSVLIAILLSGAAAGAQTRRHNHRKPVISTNPVVPVATPSGRVIGKQVTLTNGSTFRADEVWKQGDDTWYRIGNVTQSVDQPIKSIDPIREAEPKAVPEAKATATTPAADSTWIILKGGGRIRVDEISENDTGAWFRRGNVSIFLERERIDRVEHDSPNASGAAWVERGWTTGNQKIDGLIRDNAHRFALDPYLVFCVIEHESHFQARAVSPKGARGLMQLMPGTARRFGVRRPFDPGENIYGGTQYLKELLGMFNGRLDLALASYNAGEGAVLKYGRNVPPYRETREYVKRLTRRYGAATTKIGDSTSPGRDRE